MRSVRGLTAARVALSASAIAAAVVSAAAALVRAALAAVTTVAAIATALLTLGHVDSFSVHPRRGDAVRRIDPQKMCLGERARNLFRALPGSRARRSDSAASRR